MSRKIIIAIGKIRSSEDCKHYQKTCLMPECDNKSTHWLTRTNQYFCQTDLVCTRHARIWLTIKKILDDS